jgi:hypothetical protein
MQSMDDVLDRHFGLIGARVRVAAAGRPGAVAIDIRRDGRAEYFELRLPRRASAAVLNRDKADRHLLLQVSVDGEKSRFLCGHDERHWFVAAIPEAASGVVNVRTAKHALQPTLVQAAAAQLRPRKGCAVATTLSGARASGSSCRRPALSRIRGWCLGGSRSAEAVAASFTSWNSSSAAAAPPCM